MSRKGRLGNAIFLLKSSSLLFHPGTAKFIALVVDMSRCLKQFGSEIVDKCTMDHYKTLSEGGSVDVSTLPTVRGSDWIKFSTGKVRPPNNGARIEIPENPVR